jgi:cytochrome c-type biogenesis protein CcmE
VPQTAYTDGPMSKGMQIAGGATVVALLLGWYAWTHLEAGASFAYFQDLEAFRAAESGMVGQHARVHGYVVLGSIERDVASKQVRFRVQNEAPHAGGTPDGALTVVYTSLETPDLFKGGAEVVVEGVLQAPGPDGEFHADKVMAKCPSKFEAAPTSQQASL